MKNIKKIISLILTAIILLSFVGCSGYANTHTSIDKEKSENIELNNKIETIDSVKAQTDKLAKNINKNISLKEVLVSLPNGDFDCSTITFIYYGEKNDNATKFTITIDTKSNTIVKTRVQKGYTSEVGKALNIDDVDSSVNLKEYSNNICNQVDFKEALSSKFSQTTSNLAENYSLELDFIGDSVIVVANDGNENFFESKLSLT